MTVEKENASKNNFWPFLDIEISKIENIKINPTLFFFLMTHTRQWWKSTHPTAIRPAGASNVGTTRTSATFSTPLGPRVGDSFSMSGDSRACLGRVPPLLRDYLTHCLRKTGIIITKPSFKVTLLQIVSGIKRLFYRNVCVDNGHLILSQRTEGLFNIKTRAVIIISLLAFLHLKLIFFKLKGQLQVHNLTSQGVKKRQGRLDLFFQEVSLLLLKKHRKCFMKRSINQFEQYMCTTINIMTTPLQLRR